MINREFIDELDILLGPENENGIVYGDIFFFICEGENIFLFVDRTSVKEVHVIELAKKKIRYENKTVNVLCPGLKKTRSPKIVQDPNGMWCRSSDEGIYILFKYNYYKAIKLDKEKRNGILNYYWDICKI